MTMADRMKRRPAATTRQDRAAAEAIEPERVSRRG